MEVQIGGQTDRQTYRQANKHIDGQTDIFTTLIAFSIPLSEQSYGVLLILHSSSFNRFNKEIILYAGFTDKPVQLLRADTNKQVKITRSKSSIWKSS
jgi:hypothetical protein